MIKKYLFLLLGSCQLFASWAQECACSATLDFVKEKLEKNYAGYADKVTAATQTDYAAHYAFYRQQADTTKTEKGCFLLTYEWTRWFRDRHIQMHTPRRGEQFAATCNMTTLDSQTLLLLLPSMEPDYGAKLEKLLAQNEDKLTRYPYLIIDCRNNPGGISNTWHLLKKYLYTQTTMVDGEQYWASADNADIVLEGLKTRHLSKKQRRYTQKLADQMRKEPGKFVGTMNARRETLAQVLPYPKKVAILTNKYCGSNCERFVLWAQQSRKVTVMGQTTAGIVDYGNLVTIHFPCFQWNLIYPIMRSNRVADGRALDNIGISPAIKLEDTDLNWVESAHCWLQEKNASPQ